MRLLLHERGPTCRRVKNRLDLEGRTRSVTRFFFEFTMQKRLLMGRERRFSRRRSFTGYLHTVLDH